jgi:hypothetical protein
LSPQDVVIFGGELEQFFNLGHSGTKYRQFSPVVDAV